MVNLFALCRLTTGLQVKRVALAQPVQAKVGHIFQTQANYFLNGVAEEVDFSGDWKPDDDELLVIDAPAEAAVITATIAANEEVTTRTSKYLRDIAMFIIARHVHPTCQRQGYPNVLGKQYEWG